MSQTKLTDHEKAQFHGSHFYDWTTWADNPSTTMNTEGEMVLDKWDVIEYIFIEIFYYIFIINYYIIILVDCKKKGFTITAQAYLSAEDDKLARWDGMLSDDDGRVTAACLEGWDRGVGGLHLTHWPWTSIHRHCRLQAEIG